MQSESVWSMAVDFFDTLTPQDIAFDQEVFYEKNVFYRLYRHCYSILLLALTSCGLELSNPLLRRVTRYNDAEKELAEKACTAIQNQDAEALRELFSEGAIKRVPNLSNDIDKLLSLFGTDIVSFDTGLPFDSGSIEGGERVTDATCLATITTSDKEYTLNLSMRVEDTVLPGRNMSKLHSCLYAGTETYCLC